MHLFVTMVYALIDKFKWSVGELGSLFGKATGVNSQKSQVRIMGFEIISMKYSYLIGNYFHLI